MSDIASKEDYVMASVYEFWWGLFVLYWLSWGLCDWQNFYGDFLIVSDCSERVCDWHCPLKVFACGIEYFWVGLFEWHCFSGGLCDWQCLLKIRFVIISTIKLADPKFFLSNLFMTWKYLLTKRFLLTTNLCRTSLYFIKVSNDQVVCLIFFNS